MNFSPFFFKMSLLNSSQVLEKRPEINLIKLSEIEFQIK